MAENIRSEIIEILKPLFGDSFINTVDELYKEDSSNEDLIELADKLLRGYLGDEAASRLIEKLLKKYKIEFKMSAVR